MFSIRLLRWLSIWQAKEYRFDRFKAFINSSEGHTEITHFINLAWSKTTLKRPARTPKLYLITLTTILLSLSTGIILRAFHTSLNFYASILLYFLIYLLIPLWIIIATVPYSLITFYLTRRYQLVAQALLQTHQPTIIGITGSFGKTTTKILLTKLLSAKYQVWMSPKSYNTSLSLPQAFNRTYRGQPFLVIEYAAYKLGEIHRLTQIFPPSLAVLTGITHQHLAIFGSISNLLKAKSELPVALIPKAGLFYNDTDPNLIKIVRKFPHLTKHPLSRIHVTQVKLDPQGHLSFTLKPEGVQIHTQLIGIHYLKNLLLAIDVARQYKITAHQIKFALETFRPTPEFITTFITHHHDLVIVDDKTSNPAGFAAAIDLAAAIKAPHKTLITSGIIDLGVQSDTIHSRLAQHIDQVFNLTVHTGDTGTSSLSGILGDKYLHTDDARQIEIILTKLPTTRNLILIEGKIPEHINHLLRHI